MPRVAESRTSAASFACLKSLGVTPPPLSGWVPVPISDGDTSQGEWHSSDLSPDWIYHTIEERYFHLPTSTLWEQREVECCDPFAPAHTFYRVDAIHLQALAQFARHMDSTLIPLTWKAWVQFTRRRRAKRIRGQSRTGSELTSMSTEMSLRTMASRGDMGCQGSVWVDKGLLDDKTETTIATVEKNLEHKNSESLSAHLVGTAAAAQLQLADRKLKQHCASQSSLESFPEDDMEGHTSLVRDSEGGPTAEVTLQEDVLPESLGQKVREQSTEATGKSVSSKASSVRRRGCCPLLCGQNRRSRRGRDVTHSTLLTKSSGSGMSERTVGDTRTPVRQELSTKTKNSNTSSVGMSRMTRLMGVKTQPVDSMRPLESDTTAAGSDVEMPQSPKAPEMAERHLRRFERFLADVKKNPQRLVSHVEQRRTDKTCIAYIVV